MQRIGMDSNILLWGAPSSGKSTLLNAFIAELFVRSTSTKHDFAYQILDGLTDTPLFEDKEKPFPTFDLTDKLIYIQRYTKIDQHLDSYEFQHKLTVRDSNGQSTIDWSRGERNSFHVSVENFEKLIVVLDSTTSDVDKKECIQDFTRLCNKLRQNKNNKKFVAVCLTKIDQMQRVQSSESLFSELFKSDVNAIKAMLASHIEMRFFSTSALGYYYNGYKNVPNYSNTSGWLEKEVDWSPLGVVNPFFWLFDKSEEEFIAQTKAIGYYRSKILKWMSPRSSRVPWLLDDDD